MSEFILGDCLEYMQKMPDNAYDLAIVDPPYGDGSGGGVRNRYNFEQWKIRRAVREIQESARRMESDGGGITAS